MPIHYINPATGSDAAAGTNWPTAWKTTDPLAALYPGATVSGVELRFAKTPKLYDAQANLNGFHNGNYFGSYGVGMVGSAVTALSGNSVFDSTTPLTSINFIMVSPFTVPFSDSGPGHYMKSLTVPVGASGRACYHSIGLMTNLATLGRESIEMWACVGSATLLDLSGLSVALHLCSDNAGLTTIASYPVTVGRANFRNVLNVLGTGALPNGVASVALYITNSTGVQVNLGISQIIAVNPINSATYTGFRAFMIPNHTPGQCLQIAAVSGNSISCLGVETAAWRNILGASNATWAVYPMTPKVPTGILFPSVNNFGLESDPVVIRGGFNTATDLVDGLSVVDADNFKFYGTAIQSVSVTMQDIAIGHHRGASPATGNRMCILGGEPGTILPTWYGARGNNFLRCYTTPQAQAGFGAGGFNGYYSGRPDSAIIYVQTGNFANSYIRNNSVIGGNYYGPPLRGSGANNGSTPLQPPSDTLVAGATICGGIDFQTQATLTNNVFYEVKTQPSYANPIFSDCGFYSSGTVASSMPVSNGTFTDCDFHGAYSVPSSGVFIRPKFNPYAFLAGAMVQGTGNSQPLELVDIQPADSTFDSAQALIEGDFYKIKVRDSIVNLRFPKFMSVQLLFSASLNPRVDIVDSAITTIHPTPDAFFTSVGAFLDHAYTVYFDDLVLGGPWTTFLKGSLPTVLTNNVTLGNALTKVIDAFEFKGNPFGSGEVSVYLGGVLTGNLTPVGSPVTGAIRSTAGTYRDSTGTLVLFTTVYRIQKDFALKVDGLFSWRMTLLQNNGSPVIGSLRVGMLTLRAGVQVSLKAKIRRGSTNAQAVLMLRPLGTKDYIIGVGQSFDHDLTTPLLTLINTWEDREILYTPTRTSTVEVYLCVYGLSGQQVWFDQVEVLQ